MRKIIDITNKKFNKLKVIKFVEINKYRQSIWLCKCDCGKYIKVQSGSLKSNNTKSCGCLNNMHRKYLNFKHGLIKIYPKEYRTWKSIKSRCYNPNTDRYKNYGGRGIKVCLRWRLSFENFLKDMGKCPSLKYSIERKDVNKNYTPNNCIWIPLNKQQKNTTKTRRNNGLL